MKKYQSNIYAINYNFKGYEIIMLESIVLRFTSIISKIIQI